MAVAILAVSSSGARAADAPPRFAGLGTHGRVISTKSPDAQAYFNQGLAFLYGFNHDEALRAFRHAATLDPECPAIHWAIALANGPHINFPLVDETHAKAAWESLTLAQKYAEKGSPVERDLIAALTTRYANPQPQDRKPLDEAYASAMRDVWKKHPGDADVGALFAESMMDLRPWDLWTLDGKAQPGTEEVLATLERVMQISPAHPMALHLYIHAVEASPYPEKATVAADRLRELEPGLGHMVHMPSHIDVRLGEWQRAIVANDKAIAADAAYRERNPDQDFYRLYMAHNYHMKGFAAMMRGQSQLATEAINTMLAEVPDAWLEKNAPFTDGMFSMPYEMHLRFGRWDEMLAEPEPKAILPISRAFRLYARGVAYAAKGEVEAARAEQQAFLAAKSALLPEAMFMQNKAEAVFGVAEKVLDGEILYRAGQVDEGLAALREAVKREDALRYIEPPDWIQPVRHILGAALIDAGKYAEAEQVFREDLARLPHNGWSLHDLARSLRLQGKRDEAKILEAAFRDAWRDADTKLSSACFCLPGRKGK